MLNNFFDWLKKSKKKNILKKKKKYLKKMQKSEKKEKLTQISRNRILILHQGVLKNE
jgi:hypothetical protein